MGHGHGEDFKRDAVRLACNSGLSRKQVAADLGIGAVDAGQMDFDVSARRTNRFAIG